MRKLIATLLLFLLPISAAVAHPLDISKTIFTIHEKGLSATTYIHSFEGQFFASKHAPETVYDFQSVFDYKDQFFAYVEERVRLQNNMKDCTFIAEDFPFRDDYVILSEGYEVHYNFECDEELKDIALTNELFTDDFELQTNKISFYQAEGANFSLKNHKVLNSVYTRFAWNIGQEADLTIVDTDKDGLSDEDERLYKTDPNKVDTDGDRYTDFEEVQFSWNPIDAELGPGQEERPEVEITMSQPTSNSFIQVLENFFLKIIGWLK